MEKKLVVYKNEFNTIPLRDFTGTEMDLLFSIMSQMRDKGISEIELSFDELKKLSRYQLTATSSFVADLEKTYDKLISLNVKVGNSEEWSKFVFFTEYTVNTEKETITIGTNKKFAHLINDLSGNFTKLELEEVTKLRSSYAKAMYRLLRQYRTTGLAIFDIDELRSLLDVPQSYKMFNIRQRVFAPIMEELPKYFDNLVIDEIKGRGKEKRQIVQVKFMFDRQFNTRETSNGKTFLTYKNQEGKVYNKNLDDIDKKENSKTYEDSEYVKKLKNDVNYKEFENREFDIEEILREINLKKENL